MPLDADRKMSDISVMTEITKPADVSRTADISRVEPTPAAAHPTARATTHDLRAALAAFGADGDRAIDVVARTEQRLAQRISAGDEFIDHAARHLIEAGGKRFRPALVALTGQLGPCSDASVLADAGAVVELVHLATLYHDDVIDEARLRRGAKTANARWNNTVAVLTGDYLFAHASELAATLGVEVTRIMAQTLSALCAGQMLEIQGTPAASASGLPPIEPDKDHYLTVIDGKTASLIATSCRLGALLSGCHHDDVERLARYGRNLGMAFQIADDVLDITGNRVESGKLAGTDLREGVRTLPVLLALDQARNRGLSALVEAAPHDETALARALTLLRRSAALHQARIIARDYVEAATHSLETIPQRGALQALTELADRAIDRPG
jgi:heptaprenyl diphosphate synthase